ncbi:MAG TPA: hypothetical protein VIU11_15015 [Nakamurella sp.]
MNVIHRPTESSQKKIGASAMAANADWSWSPNISPIADARSRGAPMSPSAGMAARHEPRAVQNVAEAERVQGRGEAGSEDGRLVTDRNQRLADGDHRRVVGAAAPAWRLLAIETRAMTPTIITAAS